MFNGITMIMHLLNFLVSGQTLVKKVKRKFVLVRKLDWILIDHLLNTLRILDLLLMSERLDWLECFLSLALLHLIAEAWLRSDRLAEHLRLLERLLRILLWSV